MAIVLSVMVFAALALVAGALFKLRRGARLQAALMLVLALVMAGNVAIWTMPGPDGAAPVTRSPQ